MATKEKRLSSLYFRKNLSLAWPLALNALLMQSMLIIDILLVSPLGEASLAAMGIATTIIAFFLGIQIALGNGTQLIVGRLFGAKDINGLLKTLAESLIIHLIAVCLFIAILVIWSEGLVGLLTTDTLLAKEILHYLSISQYILLLNGFAQVIIVFLSGQGNTKTAFLSYAIELPFNAVFSYFLIFGSSKLAFEGLGVAGAAFGSLAAVILRLAFLLRHVNQLPILKNFKLHQHIRLNTLASHFNEILPIATNFLILSLGTTVYQLLFSQLDVYSYVAVSLVFPWLRVATQCIVAWAQANAINISQALGRNKTSHINMIVNNCIKLGLILSVAMAVALYIFSQSVKFIYPKMEDQTLFALASIIPFYVSLPLFRTYNTIAGNVLRALGRSVQILKIHFYAQWLIVLPLCSLFVLYFKLSLPWAFALLPFEEALKIPFFYLMLRNAQLKINEINSK